MSAPRLVASTLDPDAAARREIVTAGSAWLAELNARPDAADLDLEGNQAVDTLFYGLARPTERALLRAHDDPRAAQRLPDCRQPCCCPAAATRC